MVTSRYCAITEKYCKSNKKRGGKLLPKIDGKRMNGSEELKYNDSHINRNLLRFWQWAYSDLNDNTLRGTLAEYIVATALEINKGVQENWKSYDLDYKGMKIEVKSSAYIQSWEQTDYSKIGFSIKKTREWLQGSQYSDEVKRQADIYVFCLLDHKNQETLNTLNLEQWSFFVVKTSELNEKLGDTQQLSLKRLMDIEHIEVSYNELKIVIDKQNFYDTKI